MKQTSSSFEELGAKSWRRSFRALATLAAVTWAVPPAAIAADCDVIYRLWEDGTNTYYNYGETLHLAVGQKVDLYVHYKSRSPTPYSTLAEIGAPTDMGLGNQRRRDVDRVLRLGDHDPRKGKQSLEAITTGGTALGYRITEVVRPGKLADIPVDCRAGEVRIIVDREARILEEPPPGAATANEAAHQLISELMAGLLRRGDVPVGDYPNEWFDRVMAEGLRGLIFVAETVASSKEFQTAALDRTRQSLAATGVSAGGLSPGVLQDQLLTDVARDLCGAAITDGPRRRLLADNLANCFRGASEGCKRFGRNLLSQAEYRDAHRDLLKHWQRY